MQQPDSVPEASSSAMQISSARRPTPHAGKFKDNSQERNDYMRRKLFRDPPLTLDRLEFSDSDNEEQPIFSSEEQMNLSELPSESVAVAKLLLKQEHKSRNLIRKLRDELRDETQKMKNDFFVQRK